MKHTIWTLASALLFLFAACQNDSTEGVEQFNNEITLYASINPRTDAETRASFDHEGNGKGNFADGDQISVYITPEGGQTIRRTATLRGAEWVFDGEKLTWGQLNANKAVFSAYYPAIDTPAGQRYTLKCETNQEFGGMLERSDKMLMCSSTFTIGQPVTLNLHHAMHLLEVNLAGGENVSQNDINTAQIYVNAYAQVEIDPATGKFVSGVGPIKQIRMRSQFTSRFRAVLCPQPILDEWHNDGWLKMNIKGKTLHYKAPLAYNNGEYFTALESGKRFRIDLRLTTEDEVIEDLTDKTIWVAGLKDMPRQTTWGYAYAEMGTLGLKYDPSYGWYDIKKLDAISPTFDDHRLCWAATTSNMIHWWNDRNKENIECYLRYKKDTDPNYVAPTFGYNSDTHKQSDVFDFFKRTCTNKGGWVSVGLRWYLRGDWINKSADASYTEDTPESHQHQNQQGFFGEVFGDSPINEFWQGGSTGYDACNFIKNALKRGDVMGIDHVSMQGSHAITMWGATFDDQGELTHIYVCDNNHSETELNQGGGVMQPGRPGPFGIFQMRVFRRPNSNTYYLESTNASSDGVNITGLESMSQGKVAWDRFWAKHPEYAPKK